MKNQIANRNTAHSKQAQASVTLDWQEWRRCDAMRSRTVERAFGLDPEDVLQEEGVQLLQVHACTPHTQSAAHIRV